MPFLDRHGIIVFGGLAGLEECVNSDVNLSTSSEDTASLFHLYLNLCPNQGSRTIRTEVFIFSLSTFFWGEGLYLWVMLNRHTNSKVKEQNTFCVSINHCKNN